MLLALSCAGLTDKTPLALVFVVENQVTFTDVPTLGLFMEGSPPEFNCMNEHYGLSFELGSAVSTTVDGTLRADKVKMRDGLTLSGAHATPTQARAVPGFASWLLFALAGCVCFVLLPVNGRPPSTVHVVARAPPL